MTQQITPRGEGRYVIVSVVLRSRHGALETLGFGSLRFT
jgi:hypothetical protein